MAALARANVGHVFAYGADRFTDEAVERFKAAGTEVPEHLAQMFAALGPGPDDVIVAPGFSCRMQIQHFTGRTAIHPAQLLTLHGEPGA